jgi:type II restriction enzyme
LKQSFILKRVEPYHPESYERWTLKGLYDLENGEILVGKDFWNFIANDNIYEELLDVFQKTGEELRGKINKKFAEFRKRKSDIL